VKRLQEKIRKTLGHIGRGNNFLNGTIVALLLRERIDKWDCIKLKGFCTTLFLIAKN
jgi:hypothetical protein